MADIHILKGNNANEWTVVMHFPVPDANNSAGVNFRTAILGSGMGLQEDGRRTILTSGTGPGQIPAVEEAQLDAGAVFEHVASFRAESGGTTATLLRLALRDFYASENVKVQADVASMLRYWGHSESAT